MQTLDASFGKGIELRRSTPAAFECLFGVCKIVVELLEWCDRSFQRPIQRSETDFAVFDCVGL